MPKSYLKEIFQIELYLNLREKLEFENKEIKW